MLNLVLYTLEVGSDPGNRDGPHSHQPHFAVPESRLSSQTSPSEARLGLSCAVSPAPKAPISVVFLLQLTKL